MCDSNKLVFAISHEPNDRLDVSGVPKAATIFCHENRWWFELDTGESSNSELNRRKRNFDWFKQKSPGINIAAGPFDFIPVDIQIEFSREANRSLYLITSINGHQLERPVERTHCPIELTNFASYNECDAVKIPSDATHYCWLNGSNIVESAAINAEANEAAMLILGGLAYLKLDQSGNYRVIQINRFQPTDSGLVQLSGPIKWKSEYTQALVDQNRFASPLNVPFIEDLRYYAFINANEEFTSSIDHNRQWIPTQNGAFLYLFNEDKSPNDRDCLYELPSYLLGVQASD